MNPSSTGLLQDNRTPDQQEFDIKYSDLFGTALPTPPVYLNGQPPLSAFEKYPWENQQGELSCVAHSRVLNNAIYNSIKNNAPFVQGAPLFVYRLRSNYPAGGMYPPDANNIVQTYGVPNYADCPDTQHEAEANALVITPALYQAALKNKSGSWASSNNPADIDTIAYATNTLGVPVSILIFAQEDEWSLQSPQILYPNLTKDVAQVCHCITALPNVSYTDSTGKRFIVIQDSAYFGGLVYRFVSEDFIKARCVGADIIVSLGMSTIITLPKYQFNNDLSFGSTGEDVLMLQTCLQSLGFFPTLVNGILFQPTQTFGAMTKNAVLAFQQAYFDKVLAPLGLQAPTGYFGASSRTFINTLTA